MTSSFGNVIGTPRDRLPDTGDNYARVEPDLTDSVNAEITRQQADTKEFYNQMIEIELLKQKNFNDNLKGIADLLGTAAKFKEEFDADKEGRELRRTAKEVLEDENKRSLFDEAIAKGEVLDSEENAFYLKGRKDNSQFQEILNTKYAFETSDISLREFKQKERAILGGIGTYALNSNVNDETTFNNAEGKVDDGINASIAAAIRNAKRLGIDTTNRKFKSYFVRELYPKIVAEKKKILDTWASTNVRTFEGKRQKQTDEYIATYLSTAVTNKKPVNLNNPDTGLITRLQNDFADRFKTPKDTVNYLVDRVAALAEDGKISRFELEYFRTQAEFTHSATKKPVKFNELGTKSDQDRWGRILDNAKESVSVSNSDIETNIKTTLEAEMRNRRAANKSGELTDIDRIEIQAMGNKMAKEQYIGISNNYFPDGLLGDTTVSSSGESYSARVGKADPLLGKVNITKDWIQTKRTAGLNTTALSSIETIEASKAMGDLTDKVNKALTADSNLTLDSAISKFYPQVLADLAAGKYKDDYDFLVPTTPVDIRTDRNTIKNDVNTTINQTGFISLHEKRGLENLAKYIEGGMKGEFPRYFEEVTRGLNITPREYAIARLRATGGIDAGNRLIKNPLDKYALTREDRDILLSFPNSTKNLNVLNADDDVSREAEMLKIFHDAAGKPEDDVYLAPPNFLNYRKRVNGDKLTVGELYTLAKKGADKFGRYAFSTQEFIEVVENAGVDKNAVFDEDTQSFMVLGLMRLQANKSNSITGAVTEGRNDWRRLTNLNIQEKETVLQFFPNLRGMPNNQFQNLQADVAKAILDSVTTRDQNKDLITP